MVQGAPEMQLEACAVVQPVGREAFLLLAESHSEYPIGAGAHVHPDQPGHFLLPALNIDMLCSAASHGNAGSRCTAPTLTAPHTPPPSPSEVLESTF